MPAGNPLDARFVPFEVAKGFAAALRCTTRAPFALIALRLSTSVARKAIKPGRPLVTQECLIRRCSGSTNGRR